MILSPILVSYYLSLHVSFSLEGPDVTACFPYQRELVHWEGGVRKRARELPQWSWHLSVLNWRAAVLVGEMQSLPDVIAEPCPGSVRTSIVGQCHQDNSSS